MAAFASSFSPTFTLPTSPGLSFRPSRTHRTPQTCYPVRQKHSSFKATLPAPPQTTPTALLLVDHGSRRPTANLLLDEVARLLRLRLPPNIPVTTCHMEIASPSIKEGFAKCVQGGAKRVKVVPFFLAPGRHATEDIPRLMEEAAASFEGVEWEVGDVLGADPKLVDVVLDRAGLEERVG